MARLEIGAAAYELRRGETALAALHRQGFDPPYSCGKGVCQVCMLRARSGSPPAASQIGLKATLRARGYFLPCICVPDAALSIEWPPGAERCWDATVASVDRLTPDVCRVRFEPMGPIAYQAGQFVNLRRPDGLGRSYSLASVPELDRWLEIHVKRLSGGRMSNWINDDLRPGQTLTLQGPNGDSFYVPGRPRQPLLLIGNGTGLAPLYGIVRQALAHGHQGPIHLYHGTRHEPGAYLHDRLNLLAAGHARVRYIACLSGSPSSAAFRAGRAETVAFADHPHLRGFRVFLCGYPPMVEAARAQAYLAGAALADIHADPFELCDLRVSPRQRREHAA